MGLRASSTHKSKQDDNVTFCIICYETDVKPQSLSCGHAFCYDCISSIYDYEDCPRCPLCRHFICLLQTEKTLRKERSWLKIGRKTANILAVSVSCCLFCYNILPLMQGYFGDWDFTMHELLNGFRMEYVRAYKDSYYSLHAKFSVNVAVSLSISRYLRECASVSRSEQ